MNQSGSNVNLGMPETLVPNGLTPLGVLHDAPPEDMQWGPKLSDGVKDWNLDFKANAS